MSRAEFMKQLEYLLQDITDSEREEALQYYEDYFDEAGPESEQRVVEELDSPEKVAAIIKNGLNFNDSEAGEFTESGYSDVRFSTKKEVAPKGPVPKQEYQEQYQQGPYQQGAYKQNNTGRTVLIVLLCILALPIILPVGIAILGAAIGILGAVFGVAIALIAATGALLIGGLVVAVVGFIRIFSGPASGLMITGVGLILFAIGIVLAILVVWICAKVLPTIFRGIVNLLNGLVHRGRA